MENTPDMLHQAKKRMHRERKWLALRLKEVYTEEEREELFERWGILQMKERKKALSLRLWDPMVPPLCLQPMHVPLSSAIELVVQ